MSTTLSSGSYVTCPRLSRDALDLYGWRVRVDQRHRRKIIKAYDGEIFYHR